MGSKRSQQMNQLERLAEESQRFTVAKLETVYKAALASTESEVEKIRDKTEMFRLCCKSNTAYGDLQNLYFEFKAQAKRRMGQMLVEVERQQGRRQSGNPTSYQDGRKLEKPQPEPPTLTEILAELHLGPMEAWR
jgi:hypothetical protein